MGIGFGAALIQQGTQRWRFRPRRPLSGVLTCNGLSARLCTVAKAGGLLSVTNRHVRRLIATSESSSASKPKAPRFIPDFRKA